MTAPFDPFAGPSLSLVVPSTEAQRELIAAAGWSEEASRAFNQPFLLRLTKGPLQIAAVQTALDQLVARHEALRSVFTPDGTTLCICKPTPVALRQHDFSHLGEPEREAELARVAAAVAAEAFDLVRGPLFRAVAVRLEKDANAVILCAHHLICDGWSIGVLVRDLGHLYSAAVGAPTPALPPASRYSDYARSEVERRGSAEARADLAYWRGIYRSQVPPLEMPYDHPRPRVKSYHADRLDHPLPLTLVQRLQRLANQTQTSLFTVLLTGFAAWLMRHSGQNEVVIGVPSAGQAISGEKELIGHCVNLLPLRLEGRSDEAFTALLARVRSHLLDAFDHQRFTYGTLLKDLPIARDGERNLLVSVMFNVEQATGSEHMPFAGLTASLQSIARRAENFELFVNITLHADGATLECQYSTDLYQDSTIAEHLASFEQLLTSLAEQPGQAVQHLKILTAKSRHKILREWNQTAVPRSKFTTIHELFSAQAQATPQALAVVGRNGKKGLAYAELNARANRLAHHLLGLGVRPGAMVGLALDRDEGLLVGLLGILKAGAAYVPLDPSYPAERLRWMFEDTQMPALVTTARLAEQLPKDVAAVVRLDVDRAAIERRPSHAPDLAASAAAPVAYVIFTSGSTGRPKGVLVPHAAVVNFLCSMRQMPGLTAADTVVAVTTVAFDIHVLELFLPLICGAKVALASAEEAGDPARLAALIDHVGATLLQATPATWRMLLAAEWPGRKGLKGLCGGERLPQELAEALLQRLGSLWNMYGPTETTVWSTCGEIKPGVQRISIGRPIANTSVYIVDAAIQPVPVGATGELLIGGDGVTLGYLNRPELTKEKFIPDPFSERSGALLYRTGDLARYTALGEIECLGRSDHQVKVRGYRIELGDLESALASHPDVHQAVCDVRALGTGAASGDPRLIAWFVAAGVAVPTAAELRTHLRTTLPSYMLPQYFIPLTALPLTPNGKIDRRQLPEPLTAQGEEGVSFQAPRSPSEKLLATLLAKLLGLGTVSVQTHLFELGADESTVATLVQRLQDQHAIDLSERMIYAAPTIAGVAAAMDRARPSAAAEQADDLNYWRRHLNNLPSSDQRPSPVQAAGSVRTTAPYSMPGELGRTLQLLAKDTGTSLRTLLLATFTVLIYRQTQQGDCLLCVETPSPWLLRMHVEPAESFVGLLRRVRDVSLQSQSHDALALAALAETLGYQDGGRGLTSYTLKCFGPALSSWSGVTLGVDLPSLDLVSTVAYRLDLYSEHHAKELPPALHSLLLALVAHPEASVSSLLAASQAQPGEFNEVFASASAVEQALLAHPSVAETAAIVAHGLTQSPRLQLYYKLKERAFVTATDLRLHLAERFDLRVAKPLLIETDEFPRLSTGLIDKLKLPSAFTGGVTQEAGQQPKTPQELALAAIWSDLLGTAQVGTNGNFFELGGHSLLAVQMISRVERETGVKLSRMAVTLNTLGQIAASLSAPAAGASAPVQAASLHSGDGLRARLLKRFRTGAA